MRIDVGLILGVAIECMIMIYYANSTLYPKKNYYISSLIAIVGYAAVFIVAIFGYSKLNIFTFAIINFMIFITGYSINYKNAIFKSMILTAISSLGEIMVMFILEIEFSADDIIGASGEESMIVTLAGKIIYFIGVLIIKYLGRKNGKHSENSFMVLILVPIITFVCIIIVIGMDVEKEVFAIICIISIAVNILTFSVNEFTISKNNRIRVLEDENSKNRCELEEYKKLGKAYEQIRIINHDFREHVRTLIALIDEDIEKAKQYIKSMKLVSEKTKSERFIDNTILNILLNEKVKECNKKGIKLYIESVNPKLDFISEIDMVAIFSNLINNAIEACVDTEDKEIFINLCTVNDVFTVIKVENSAYREPVVLEGMLRTHKNDKQNHGIGIKSINNSLRKYGGNMSWTYDKVNKKFRTTVIINTKQFYTTV